MITPARATVAPRVFVDGGNVALRLEDEIAERLDAGTETIIHLAGPAGCGKGVALAHLAFVFANDPRLMVYEHAGPLKIAELEQLRSAKIVVLTGLNIVKPIEGVLRWQVAPWNQDAWIEYLLAAHHDRCASVMKLVLADEDRGALGDRAELWQPVLDAMASDESLPDVRTALRAVVYRHLPTMGERHAAIEHCFALCKDPEVVPHVGSKATIWSIDVNALKLLRHSFPQTLLGAERLALAIEKNQGREFLTRRLPISLIQETARLIADDEAALADLETIVTSRRPAGQPMAASLLHASRSDWAPRNAAELTISGAYLAGAQWRGLRITEVNAQGADLTDCNLREAHFFKLDVSRANLTGATLREATIRRFYAAAAELANADLASLRAANARFCEADLSHTNLEAALLRRADFRAADLRGANFCRADLRGADLVRTLLAGADFSGADLSYSDLSGVAVHEAEFAGANLEGASLHQCNLEGMILPGARLKHAELDGAYLTGSRMPNADLRGACLKFAGLAEIDWEQADLRNADLRGCTFHMGSSRSGLVGSPIASEGSRTGFYTDELNEQDFKSPEEIRKANLRGSDLRGAKILNVDFYLVDVRDCRYTPEQETHLRRTGAILETRV